MGKIFFCFFPISHEHTCGADSCNLQHSGAKGKLRVLLKGPEYSPFPPKYYCARLRIQTRILPITSSPSPLALK